MVRLGDIGIILTGNTPKTSNEKNYISKDINFVKPSDFAEDKITDISTSDYFISELARKEARILPVGSVLVTCIGIIGKVGINSIECAFNQQINAIIPDTKKCNNKFLAYAIQFKKDKLQELANAPVVPILNKTQFSNIQINLPSIEEQNRIVAILDKVNKIINNRKLEIKKLDELVKSRFIEMFGDPVKNEKNLPIGQLSEIGILERGKSQYRPRNAPELLGGSYPLIQTGDVSNSNIYITTYNNTYSELGLKQSKLWEPGTLCITIAANIAQTAILTFKACFPDSVVGFIPNNNTNVVFIHYWFGFFQKILEEQAHQVAQKNINLKILSELKVILPTINLQNQFATFVEQTNKSKLEIQKSLDKLEILKKSLMQEYFS